MPVIVGSRISGKALFVPVDRPAIGSARRPTASSRTTARCVPSPPRTTIAATPARCSSRVAVKVSSTPDVGSMSRNSISGSAASAPRLRWRSSSARMPPRSGITRARFTPQAAAAVSTRSTMFTRSVICRLPALATMRRMSRADTGLATTPMVAVARDAAAACVAG